MIRAAALAVMPGLLSAQSWTEAQVAAAMGDRAYVLLLDDGATPRRWTRGLTAEDTAPPCSTFKLPHALLALDAGVVTADSRLVCAPGECHADHGRLDLAAAIRQSCVSFFRQTARRLGPARMAQGLAQLGYPASGALEPLDGFWLGPGYRLSAGQQLAWIRRFYTATDLGVASGHLDAVREASVREPERSTAVRGKTGTSGRGTGWFVGELRREGRATWVVVRLEGSGASGPEAERRLRSLLRQ